MNKLDYSSASALGIKVTLDDFEFEQQGIEMALTAISKAIGNNFKAIRLSGIDITEGVSDYTITDGYIMIGGEVCFFESGVFPKIVGGSYYWAIEQTDDPAGVKTLELDPLTDIYFRKIRKAILTDYTGTIPSGEIDLNSFKDVSKTILEQIANDQPYIRTILWPILNAAHPAGTTLVCESNWSNVTGNLSKYRKTADNYLELYLNVGELVNSGNKVATLAAGHWPLRVHRFSGYNSGGDVSHFEIQNDGDIFWIGGTISYGGTSGAPTDPFQAYIKIPLTW